MCGIFGIITTPRSGFPRKNIAELLKSVAIFSESRGKDSSGIAFRIEQDRTIQVIKGDVPIRKLINSEAYNQELNKGLDSMEKGNGFSAFGHARLVTNGSQLQEVNNQPVLKNGMLVIHNGIIVNVEELWLKHRDMKRDYMIDTEIIPALVRKEILRQDNIVSALNNALNQLVGTYSIATMFEDLDQFVLATNNGSLYYITDNRTYIIFASENYILEKLFKVSGLNFFNNGDQIQQLFANHGLVINLKTLELKHFELLNNKGTIQKNISSIPFKLEKHLIDNQNFKQEVVIDPSIFINRSDEQHLFKHLENNIDSIRKIHRCSKCLLPETFPFVEFDEQGVCNYCRNYKPKHNLKTIDEFKSVVEPFRSKNGKSDCIVPFSGGRDSTYTLHIVKKDLGLNPIAFTYDWGMVTDLARRNIARVCGKLGVENIIVSADIHWKRENIRKNVQAWLKFPSLGMIPLFMAGDKFFFYYTNQVKKQTGIDLNIWGINNLENTEFKTGFAGLSPNFEKERIYSISILNQLKLFGFVGKNVLRSPGYINQSVIDSLGSFAARYIAEKRDYYHLFDYYQWNETEINDLIQNEYKWETAIDTKSTWRIGDGTASFYNYIYYTVAGFSENDTFRSNQIREGMIDRDTALKLCEIDNIPRYETIRWYLEIIGLDFISVINIINKIPKLYSK